MLNKKITEMTIGELLFLIDNSIKTSFEEEANKINEKINARFEKIEKKINEINLKLKNMEKKLNEINIKLNYMNNEIQTIKLTQNFVLEKPLDSVSLSSFLTEPLEENSFFKLFR